MCDATIKNQILLIVVMPILVVITTIEYLKLKQVSIVVNTRNNGSY